jgi:hypothetical protein
MLLNTHPHSHNLLIFTYFYLFLPDVTYVFFISTHVAPGGPTSSTPFGGRAPEARNFSGLRKKSTTSISSTFLGGVRSEE